MFGALPYHIIGHKDLTHADVRVLLAFAAFAGDNGRAFPSVRRIETETPLSRRAIQSSLKKCVRLGLLKVEHRADDRGSTSSVYTFQFQRFDTSSTPRRNENAPRRSQEPPPAQPVRPPGAMVAPKHTKEQTKEHKTPSVKKLKWEEQPWAPVVHAYRLTLPSLPVPQTRSLNGKVGGHIAARWKEKPDSEWWTRLFKAVAADEHYRGDRDWKGASLRWIVEPNGWGKCLERFHKEITNQSNTRLTACIAQTTGFEE